MIQKVLVVLGCAFLTGCMSFGSVSISDVDRPLLDIQKIVQRSLPLGLRETSTNGREFYSNFFLAKDRRFKPAEKMPERYYAHVLILGDARPYTIKVHVRRQKVESVREGIYRDLGADHSLAKAIQRRIQEQLNKRREDLNIIDDFRVF